MSQTSSRLVRGPYKLSSPAPSSVSESKRSATDRQVIILRCQPKSPDISTHMSPLSTCRIKDRQVSMMRCQPTSRACLFDLKVYLTLQALQLRANSKHKPHKAAKGHHALISGSKVQHAFRGVRNHQLRPHCIIRERQASPEAQRNRCRSMAHCAAIVATKSGANTVGQAQTRPLQPAH